MGSSVSLEQITRRSSTYEKPPSAHFSYGTAGFRAPGNELGSTVFRCGLLTAVRARALGQPCGLMITASHNPEHDNGVKIVEPHGEMLSQARSQPFVALCPGSSFK